MAAAGRAQVTAEARLVDSIAFWLRAYPRRWRALRGGELAGLVLDLAPPGATRLGWKAALDLLRGGWSTRWREHPPLHRWLAYRGFDARLPAHYRAWAIDDIDGFWFSLRRYLGATWWWTPYILVQSLLVDDARWLLGFAPFFVLGAIVSIVVAPQRDRRRARLKHLALQPGEPVVAGALVVQDAPRARATATSELPWAAMVLVVAGAAAGAAAAFAPKVLTVVPGPAELGRRPGTLEFVVEPVGGRGAVAAMVLAAALALGLLGAVVARRRLRRLLAARPFQPNRVLHPLSSIDKAGTVFWATLIGVLAWLEVSGRLVLGPSVALGTAALLALPGLLVALAVTRRAGHGDLASRDLWWIAAHGRAPAVDDTVLALRPLAGPVPEGASVRWPAEPPYPALP